MSEPMTVSEPGTHKEEEQLDVAQDEDGNDEV
jgi:hypothetical protein